METFVWIFLGVIIAQAIVLAIAGHKLEKSFERNRDILEYLKGEAEDAKVMLHLSLKRLEADEMGISECTVFVKAFNDKAARYINISKGVDYEPKAE